MSHSALALVTVVSLLAAFVFAVATLARRKGLKIQYRRDVRRLHSARNRKLKRHHRARSRSTSWEAGTADAGGIYYSGYGGDCGGGSDIGAGCGGGCGGGD